jgi:hypothetical protein
MLHTLIAWKFFKYFGLATFGISTTTESQRPSGLSPPDKKLLTAEQISSLKNP